MSVEVHVKLCVQYCIGYGYSKTINSHCTVISSLLFNINGKCYPHLVGKEGVSNSTLLFNDPITVLYYRSSWFTSV
jgi:hypothetical protein